MKLDQYQEKYKDDRFYQEVFEHEIYAPMNDSRHKTVIDIGALGGEFSIWLKDNAEQIFAIEPHKDQYQELEENTEDFGNIFCFNLALSNENGESNLGGNVRGGYSLNREEGGQNLVQTQTLATFMKNNNIVDVDLLKIDIEGNEMLVFSSKDFSGVSPKIKTIIGEHLDGDVKERLESLGFKAENYQHGLIFRRINA